MSIENEGYPFIDLCFRLEFMEYILQTNISCALDGREIRIEETQVEYLRKKKQASDDQIHCL